MKTIGLTGGIGSGKSTVAQILAELGAHVIHADLVGHEVYQPATIGWRRVTEAFGKGIVAPDGTIDRQKLSALVFDHPSALARLNAIVHPLIEDAIRERIKAHRAAGRTDTIVLEAAVLIEANWLPLVDEVWVVTASKDLVVQRVQAQRGIAAEAVSTRVAAQIDDDQRRRHATVVIENTGSIAELRARVRAAWKKSCGTP